MIYSTNDIRARFHIETGFPDVRLNAIASEVETDVIQRKFPNYAQWDTTPASFPAQVDRVKRIVGYITAARVLWENDTVATGFGIVEKVDEYSKTADTDKVDAAARRYMAQGSAHLRALCALEGVGYDMTADLIPFIGGVSEGYFSK